MENNVDDVVVTDIVLKFIDDADVAVFVSVVVVIIVGEVAELAKLL